MQDTINFLNDVPIFTKNFDLPTKTLVLQLMLINVSFIIEDTNCDIEH